MTRRPQTKSRNATPIWDSATALPVPVLTPVAMVGTAADGDPDDGHEAEHDQFELVIGQRGQRHAQRRRQHEVRGAAPLYLAERELAQVVADDQDDDADRQGDQHVLEADPPLGGRRTGFAEVIGV